jgi:hypothetical protein
MQEELLCKDRDKMCTYPDLVDVMLINLSFSVKRLFHVDSHTQGEKLKIR